MDEDQWGAHGENPPWESGGGPLSCDFCGSMPATDVSLSRGVGMVIVRRSEQVDAALCRDCGTSVFRSMTNRTLLFGWWGFLAFFSNWGHLARNLRARRTLAGLSQPMPGPTVEGRPLGVPLSPGKPVFQRVGFWLAGGFASLVVLGAVMDTLAQAGRDGTGAIATAGDLSINDLVVGDCFDDPGGMGPDGMEITEIEALPCASLHDNEVYYVGELADAANAAYPGDDAVFERVGSECFSRFETFVGAPYETSDIDFMVVTPVRDSWSGGDRRYMCAAYDLGGPVMGSLAGVGR